MESYSHAFSSLHYTYTTTSPQAFEVLNPRDLGDLFGFLTNTIGTHSFLYLNLAFFS